MSFEEQLERAEGRNKLGLEIQPGNLVDKSLQRIIRVLLRTADLPSKLTTEFLVI